MKVKDLFLVAGLLATVFIATLFNEKDYRKQVYDCTISEISPDYPLEVKEACRRLRADRIK
jgi:hypothetical protein